MSDNQDQFYQAEWPRFCAEIKKSYDNVNNPMYAWEVIGKWAYLKNVMEIEVQLPEWCVQYLLTSSVRLRELSRGVDVTKSHTKQLGPPDSTLEQSKRHPLVSQALGLSYKRWSAFADYQSRAMKHFESLHYDILRSRGFSGAEVIKALDTRPAPRVERTIRRRVAEGRGTKLKP